MSKPKPLSRETRQLLALIDSLSPRIAKADLERGALAYRQFEAREAGPEVRITLDVDGVAFVMFAAVFAELQKRAAKP